MIFIKDKKTGKAFYHRFGNYFNNSTFLFITLKPKSHLDLTKQLPTNF